MKSEEVRKMENNSKTIWYMMLVPAIVMLLAIASSASAVWGN